MRVAALLAFAAVVTSVAIPPTHEVHEKRDKLQARWTQGKRLAPRSILPMRIGLTQNLADAEDHLMQVSDPDSPNFGKYWTSEQVIEKFRPSDDTVQTVHEWLVQSGIAPSRITHSDNKGWLAFDATAAEAESLLHTTFYDHHDRITGSKVPACDKYHIPKHIQKHVDFVTPGIKLFAPSAGNAPHMKRIMSQKRHEKRASGKSVHREPLFQNGPQNFPGANLSTCDETITPACIQALYKFPPTDKHRQPNPSNALGIYETALEFWYQPSLDKFYANFTPYIPAGTHPTLKSVDGGVGATNISDNDGGETELDLQLAYPIIYPQKINYFDEDDIYYQANPVDNYTGGFNHVLDAIDGSYCTYSAYGETGDDPVIDPTYPDPNPGGYKGKLQCGVYKPPNVLSVSYGGQEADVPYAYQRRQCNEFLKLGLQGVSIFYASGDAGVGNYPAPYGDDNPDTGCLGPDGRLFNPTWPNNCPYVTNVGATKVYPGKSVFEPESAVFDPVGHPYHVNFSSGGGFSNIHGIPSYQAAAVAQYFATSNPPYKSYSVLVNDTSQIASLGAHGGVYNRIGRGIPDVAANGDNIAVYTSGEFDRSGGTSASTPIFASIINRIVEERLRIGKGPLGFMNPTLYKNPGILNDITNGTNPGCFTLGFETAKGWDPVTGLGTPNYPKMLALYLSLP